MRIKQGMIAIGTLISLILLIVVFSQLDWAAFRVALSQLYWPLLLFTLLVVAVDVFLRALRWNLTAGLPLTWVGSFWQALNIGYLGNFIYPARAGEVLRIVAIHHFSPLTLGHAVSSALLDRLLDVFVLGLLVLLVISLHGQQILGPSVVQSLVAMMICGALGLGLVIYYSPPLYGWLEQRPLSVSHWRTRLHHLLLQGLAGLQTIRQPSRLLLVLSLTLLVFLFDFYAKYQIMLAFGWSLPFAAALTLVCFIFIGSSLPSAPGYVGVYQVACVLALGLYGIPKTEALAYSIVSQLLDFLLVCVQALAVISLRGFSLTQARQEADTEAELTQ